MNTTANQLEENTSKAVANDVTQKKNTNESTFQFEDNRPEVAKQRKLQDIANNNPQAQHTANLQAMMHNNNSPEVQRTAQLHTEIGNHPTDTVQLKKDFEEEPVQEKAVPLQLKNNTGLPDNLKAGVENLSGVDISDVKVHYNSEKPAQLNAHAYAQGTDIHVASGQEKHLAHEAWHVVQQKQGRVKPTMQLREKVNINDDVGLEKEADVMGAKALQMKVKTSQQKENMVKVVAYPSTSRDLQKVKSNYGEAKTTAQLLKIAEITEKNERQVGIVPQPNSDTPVQMVRVEPLGDIGISLADIVASMNTRAAGATSSMLDDFAELHADYIYYVAWNELDGADARYGIMSIKAAPAPLDDEADDGIIAGSLWVEGLVADAGGGFGGLLLAKAEQLAQENGIAAVALAAYEYDMADQDDIAIHQPYSVASYYEHKGYVFSGEGYVEVDNGREYFYPIYLKQTVAL